MNDHSISDIANILISELRNWKFVIVIQRMTGIGNGEISVFCMHYSCYLIFCMFNDECMS